MLKVDRPDDEYTDETKTDKGLGEVLLHICWMVLGRNIERGTMYQSLLMHFLALLGIDLTNACLRYSFLYTPYLAGLLWVSRLLMLEYSLPCKKRSFNALVIALMYWQMV
jgi:hypothetical protein